MFLERIAATVSRYGLLARGQRVGVAVSGGADSVCLLHVLRELSSEWQLQLSVLHVNHRLRGAESDADEAFVRELGDRLGLPVECHAADVRRLAEASGDNLEQAARRVRREFFLGFLRAGAVDRVALGHTRSDQAETVLFRFLRGSGTAGLAGMRPLTAEGFVRPLLEVDRAEVEAFLRERAIAWREDPSNRDPVFARNRIRHQVLPWLARDFNPGIVSTLAGTARLAQAEEDYWAALLDRLAPEYLVARPPAVLMRVKQLLDLPGATARRLIRRAVEQVRGDLRGIDFPHIDGVLRLAGLHEGSGRFQAPGLDVFRSFEWIRLAPPDFDTLENRNYRMPAAVPGRYAVPGTRTSIHLELTQAPVLTKPAAEVRNTGYNERESTLDWGRVSGSLEIRNWRPGDQYRPVGHTSQIKVKSLFQDARVPLWDRRRWPLLVSGGAVLWAARFGPAVEIAASPNSQTLLRVREIGETTELL